MEASLAALQQRCHQQEARAEQLAAAGTHAQSRLSEANFMIDQLKALLDGQAAALSGKVGHHEPRDSLAWCHVIMPCGYTCSTTLHSCPLGGAVQLY